MCVCILDKCTSVRLHETVQNRPIFIKEYNNYQNVNNTLHSTEYCHTCVLVTCFLTYIYNRRIGLQIKNNRIQPLLLAGWTKL